MKRWEQHPFLISLLIHGLVLVFFSLVFWTRDHFFEEIPVEITEFVRNLGAPSATTQKKIKTDVKKEAKSSKAVSDSKSSVGFEETSEDYEVSEMPILLNEVRVPYPVEARSRNIQGNVVFELLISSGGEVRGFQVISSPDPILTQAAEKAISRFRFRPARMADKNVAIRIRYTYRFLLQ